MPCNKTICALTALLVACLGVASTTYGQGAAPSDAKGLSCPKGTEPHDEVTDGSGVRYCATPEGVKQGPITSWQLGARVEEGQYDQNLMIGIWTQYWPDGSPQHRRVLAKGVEHGPWTAWYEDGTKAGEGTYAQGVEDGVWREWSETGALLLEHRYDKGLPDGVWTEFFDDGSKSSVTTYAHGELHGVSRTWSAPKQQAGELTYEQGVPHGAFTEWHSNGQKALAAHYRGGMLQGSYEEWDAFGQRMQSGSYDQDQMSGAWTTWHPNGQKASEGGYVAGQMHGPWQEWAADGSALPASTYVHGYRLDVPFTCPPATTPALAQEAALMRYGCFDAAGVKQGPEVQWHSPTVKASHGSYHGGFEDGPWTTWHSNGATQSVGWWRLGKREGAWKWFHANGAPAQAGAFVEGSRNGTWTGWSPQGTVVSEATFTRGVAHGESSEWASDGTRTVRLHEHGELLSETAYWPTGTLHRQASFVGGARQGKTKEYSATGELVAHGQYDRGRQIGRWVQVAANGDRAEGLYVDGARDGLWVTQHADGSRTETTYATGQRVDESLWDADGCARPAGAPTVVQGASPRQKTPMGLAAHVGLEYGRVVEPDRIGDMANTLAAHFDIHGVMASPGLAIALRAGLGGATEGGLLYDLNLGLGTGGSFGGWGFVSLTAGVGTNGVVGDFVDIALTTPIELLAGVDIADTVHLIAFWRETYAHFQDTRAAGAPHALFADELAVGLELGLAEHLYTRDPLGVRVTYLELMGTEAFLVSVGLSGMLVE